MQRAKILIVAMAACLLLLPSAAGAQRVSDVEATYPADFDRQQGTRELTSRQGCATDADCIARGSGDSTYLFRNNFGSSSRYYADFVFTLPDNDGRAYSGARFTVRFWRNSSNGSPTLRIVYGGTVVSPLYYFPTTLSQWLDGTYTHDTAPDAGEEIHVRFYPRSGSTGDPRVSLVKVDLIYAVKEGPTPAPIPGDSTAAVQIFAVPTPPPGLDDSGRVPQSMVPGSEQLKHSADTTGGMLPWRLLASMLAVAGVIVVGGVVWGFTASPPFAGFTMTLAIAVLMALDWVPMLWLIAGPSMFTAIVLLSRATEDT